MVYLFDVPAYFILLRETLECTIILAVLLGFIDKLVPDNDAPLRRKLKRQIWMGSAAGLGISLLIAAIFIIIFYTIKKNLWEESEPAWEGAFSIIASVVISFMALSMVRVQQWKTKWEGKLKDATERYLHKHDRGNKWALILLPLTVVVREGVETIVFIAGIGFQNPPSGLPIPIITGIISGFIIGFIIYKGSHRLPLTLFFGITTVFLLFVAAGLFSNAIYELQEATADGGDDDDDDDDDDFVWNLKCCDPEKNGFWGIMNALFGWRNKTTVGPTIGYFVYWLAIGIFGLFMWYKGKRSKRNAELERNDQPSSNDNEKDEPTIITTA